jgi:hypothetical protein
MPPCVLPSRMNLKKEGEGERERESEPGGAAAAGGRGRRTKGRTLCPGGRLDGIFGICDAMSAFSGLPTGHKGTGCIRLWLNPALERVKPFHLTHFRRRHSTPPCAPSQVPIPFLPPCNRTCCSAPAAPAPWRHSLTRDHLDTWNHSKTLTCCDALRCSGPHARYTDRASEYITLAERSG